MAITSKSAMSFVALWANRRYSTWSVVCSAIKNRGGPKNGALIARTRRHWLHPRSLAFRVLS